MSLGRGHSSPSVDARSIRVALAAALVVGLGYVLIAVALVLYTTASTTARIDMQLAHGLELTPGSRPQFGGGEARPPVNQLRWDIAADGSIVHSFPDGITLPAQYRQVAAPTTVSINGEDIRLAGTQTGPNPDGAVYTIVGQPMTDVTNAQASLISIEIPIGLALIALVFIGSVLVGRRVAQPIEDARRRQLEFTADASHELRTPLSVIEAQTTLALAKERPAEWYRTAFDRVAAESRRMRRLVDDMLWLARFDATGGHPSSEPVDVNVLAGATVDRFRAVAETRHIALAVRGEDGQIVNVPPEWLDRLLGVLLDNACKYSPDGGMVAVSVAADGRRVRLSVDDSGPGIPPAERTRIFDRFHRATDAPGGAGLGLAIADSIVRATDGQWTIGTSAAGGASIAVSWPRSMTGPTRRESHARQSTGETARDSRA